MNHRKIEIRSCEPEDLQAIHELHVQPKAVWGTLQLPFASAGLWEKRLTERREGHYWLVACVDSRVVGSLGLSVMTRSPRRRHAAEIGIVVHDQWQARGVGSALMAAAVELADRWLNLTRLELIVFTDNTRAIALYERLGFTVEGTLRNYAFRAGRFVDAHTMARVLASGSAGSAPGTENRA